MKITFTLIFILIFALSSFAQTKPDISQQKIVLKSGDIAPDFDLKDQNGKTVKLSKVIKKSPVMLVFYRGFW